MGYDVNVYVLAADGYLGYSDYDDGSDSDDFEAYAEAFDQDYGSPTEISAYGATEPNSSSYAPWVSAFVNVDYSNDTYGWSNAYAEVSATAEYTIGDHPFYASAGQATNSATLRAYLWFSINPVFAGEGPPYRNNSVQMYAQVGSSNVTVVALDDEGENWSVDGSLSQSSSASPSASPTTLDTTVLDGFHEWEATEATQADDIIEAVAEVDVDSSVLDLAGSDDSTYFVQALYGVVVP
jgi:hypothetical protein